MTYKILATEFFELPVHLPSDVSIDMHDGLWRDKQKLIDVANGYDALIVRNMTKVDADFLSQVSSIKVIGRLGTGIENIDLVQAAIADSVVSDVHKVL